MWVCLPSRMPSRFAPLRCFLRCMPANNQHGTRACVLSSRAPSLIITVVPDSRVDGNAKVLRHHPPLLDERRDKRIVDAHARGAPLTERTTANRAVQAYKGATAAASKSGSGAVNQVAQQLGNMTFQDGSRGRPKTIKSMAKTSK